MITNSRIAFYSSLFRDEEIPTLLFFHMIVSSWSRFDLHVFVFLCSLSRPVEMLRYWRCYLLDEEKGRGTVRRHSEESLGWLGGDGGLMEGETVVSELEKPSKSKKVSAIKVVKPSDWDSLPDTDLRYIYSQRQPEKTMHERLKGKGVIVDMASLFKQAG